MGSILSILGWHSIDSETEKLLSENSRLVMVYPHTSHFDFFLYLLYRSTSPQLTAKCKLLINPYWMERLGPILETFGAIRSTRREDSGGGAVERVIRNLKNKEFIFLISPKGARDRHSWRSGYYRIAQETNAKIVCAGFNYHQHRFVMGTPFEIGNMTLEEVEMKCKREMCSMTPLHLHFAEYPLDAQQLGLETSFVDSQDASLIFAFVISALSLLLLLLMSLIKTR